MPTDRYSALNEILTLFQAGWAENAASVLGLDAVPHVEYPGVDNGFLPTGDVWWARISIQTPVTEQGSFCENVVASGSKRYTTYGFVFVQLFAPKRNDAFVLLTRLENMVQNIFKNATPNVIFRNGKAIQLPSENGCLRSNVVVEFDFDEISSYENSNPYYGPSKIEYAVDGGTFN